MVVFNRIFGVFTGLLVAAVLAVSAAGFLRPPVGPDAPGGPNRTAPVLTDLQSTRVPTPAPAVHTAALLEAS